MGEEKDADNLKPDNKISANASGISSVPAKKTSFWWIFLFICLLFLAGFVWFLATTQKSFFPSVRDIDKFVDKKIGEFQDGPAVKQTSSSPELTKLVANWDTGCLIPDPDSPWAERHKFEIKSDGTATHWRWSGASCSAIVKEEPQNYRIEIPASGKINFLEKETGAPWMWDIYEISGDNLYFGHGFNNGMTTSTLSGGSEGDRFNGLNKFLAYKKAN